MTPLLKIARSILAYVVAAATAYYFLTQIYGTGKAGWELLGDLLTLRGWYEMLSSEAALLVALNIAVIFALTWERWWPLLFGNSESGKRARTEWEDELYDHRFDRREFWRLAEVAYTNWPQKPAGNRSLRDLIRGAEFPSQLPLADNSTFPAWAWSANGNFSDDASQLLGFASANYPAATPPMAVKSQIMGSPQEFDRFDDIRMALAKFWDHWGRQQPLEQVIREQKADPIVRVHASEIKLLTFLEIARVLWSHSDLPGKSGLFRLGQRNAETGA